MTFYYLVIETQSQRKVVRAGNDFWITDSDQLGWAGTQARTSTFSPATPATNSLAATPIWTPASVMIGFLGSRKTELQ